jgi:hypothetical protein
MSAIKKCTCGSMRFFLHESSVLGCRLDEGGLSCGNADGQLDDINCEECDATYTADDFPAIDFN